jgi:hypothetical protein
MIIQQFNPRVYRTKYHKHLTKYAAIHSPIYKQVHIDTVNNLAKVPHLASYLRASAVYTNFIKWATLSQTAVMLTYPEVYNLDLILRLQRNGVMYCGHGVNTIDDVIGFLANLQNWSISPRLHETLLFSEVLLLCTRYLPYLVEVNAKKLNQTVPTMSTTTVLQLNFIILTLRGIIDLGVNYQHAATRDFCDISRAQQAQLEDVSIDWHRQVYNIKPK